MIRSGVTTIDQEAFYGCEALTGIEIPDSVTSIGTYAFGGCTGLTAIVIPNGVTDISYGLFSGCIGLTSITLGKGVKTIDHYAFFNCKLNNLNFAGTSGQWRSIEKAEYWHYCSNIKKVICNNGTVTL